MGWLEGGGAAPAGRAVDDLAAGSWTVVFRADSSTDAFGDSFFAVKLDPPKIGLGGKTGASTCGEANIANKVNSHQDANIQGLPSTKADELENSATDALCRYLAASFSSALNWAILEEKADFASCTNCWLG